MKRFNFTFITLAIGLLFGLLFYRSFDPSLTLPKLGAAPSFSLVDSSAKEWSSEQLKGKTWLLNFFFTSCPEVCPKVTANVASLSRSYVLDEAVAFVSVSVDPTHDTPEELAKYAKKFEANTAKWHFLTGTQEQVDALQEALKVKVGVDPAVHSTRFFLIDPSGEIRGTYLGLDPDSLKQLAEDLGSFVN